MLSGRPAASTSVYAAGFLPLPAGCCSDSGLPRTAVVGVLGGGQLGRMMALAAVRIGSLERTCMIAAACAEHVLQDDPAGTQFNGVLQQHRLSWATACRNPYISHCCTAWDWVCSWVVVAGYGVAGSLKHASPV